MRPSDKADPEPTMVDEPSTIERILPSWPLQRRDADEVLDELASRPGPRRREVARSLCDIARIHRMGGARRLEAWLIDRARAAGRVEVTLLDAGCGDGSWARRLSRALWRAGLKARVVGLDLNATHLDLASARSGQIPSGFDLVRADALRLPLQNKSVDFVVSTLFAHHLSDEAVLDFWRQSSRVARLGWACNDLSRDGAAMAAFRLARPLLARSWITRYDGAASIRRARTPSESAALADAGVRTAFMSTGCTRVLPEWPWRHTVCWWPAGSQGHGSKRHGADEELKQGGRQ